jgi:hypothetical protein
MSKPLGIRLLPKLQPASDSDLESESDSDDEFVPPPKSTVPVSDAVCGATTSVGSARIDLLHRRLGHLSESGLPLLRRRVWLLVSKHLRSFHSASLVRV